MRLSKDPQRFKNWRRKLHEVIYEADTLPGKVFDIVLIVAITASVIAVCLDSVSAIHNNYYQTLRTLEWFFTGLFTLEYLFRIISVKRPRAYVFSFFGLVDLIAILPTYLSLLSYGMHTFLVVRILRLLRIFRILKMAHYLGEAEVLGAALLGARRKITLFLFVVLTIVFIFAAAIYLIEDESSGFTSIPQAVYWAVVTVTTVGYGDIVPQTVAGKLLSASLMIIGYAIIAVPTGIVSAEFIRRYKHPLNTQACPSCGCSAHDMDAVFCKKCGDKL